MTQPVFNVEIASIDQYGYPGFVHYRGAFYTSRSAGAFALTQAAALSDTRGVDAVSVVIDAVVEGSSRRDVEFIGSPGDLADKLTALPAYKNALRVRATRASELDLRAREDEMLDSKIELDGKLV